MTISEEERFKILMLEMGLIQSTLDKYDDLIFRNRNWFITLWMGAIALGLTKSEILIVGSAFVAILFWFIEGLMRHQYWYKYVLRYRAIRDHLNDHEHNEEHPLSLYDLTNKYPVSPTNQIDIERIQKSFFKIDSAIVYGCLAFSSLVLWCLVCRGVLDFVN